MYMLEKFECKLCNYITYKRYNWERHKYSDKHIQLLNPESLLANNYRCKDCGKNYKHRASLARHIKKCHNKEYNIGDSNIIVNKDHYINNKIKAELYNKQSKDINDMKILLNQFITNKPNNIQNNIQNNLNINIILESKCQDAIPLNDFVNKLQLSLEDLFYTKNNGYIEGVSNVFLKNLKELEPEKRPIQCSDKRGTSIYIKDTEVWKKDNDGTFLDNQITAVSKKQLETLKHWEKLHPNWMESENETKIYIDLVQKVLGGTNDEEVERNNKLIQKKIGQKCNISDIIV